MQAGTAPLLSLADRGWGGPPHAEQVKAIGWEQEAHAIIRCRDCQAIGASCAGHGLPHAGGLLRLVSGSAGRQAARQELSLQGARAHTPHP